MDFGGWPINELVSCDHSIRKVALGRYNPASTICISLRFQYIQDMHTNPQLQISTIRSRSTTATAIISNPVL
jgi:hypothetical protein